MATSVLDQYLSTMASTSNKPETTAAPTSSDVATGFSAVGFAENDHFIRLTLDLPGVAVKDLSVEVQHGVLVVRGKRETRLRADGGLCHQHKFCRRFAMDTDVVNIHRVQANLNKQGVLVIMAPKMRLPSTLQIPVTEHEDKVFEASLTKSFLQQQQLAADLQEEEEEEEEVITKTAQTPTNGEDNAEEIKPTAESLPNVVSMASTAEALKLVSKRKVAVKANHKSSLQSHLMIRRSMSKDMLSKNKVSFCS